MSQAEIIQETKQRQAIAWKELGGRDFERIDNSQMREAKRRMNEEEMRYNYNLRKYGK